ncbi:MAG TPA: hypothetical protein VK177_16510 [Flavobacteriales bacterium]|nr:hypothetical protein [Flavobacteriales bacterium]
MNRKDFFVELTSGKILTGYSIEGEKNGIWFELDDSANFVKLDFYFKSKLLLNIDLSQSLRNGFNIHDSTKLKQFMTFPGHDFKDTLHVPFISEEIDNKSYYEAIKTLPENYVLVQLNDGIVLSIGTGFYSEKQLCLSVPCGNDREVNLFFQQDPESYKWNIIEVYSVKNGMLDGEYYVYNEKKYPSAIIPFKYGFLDGVAMVIDDNKKKQKIIFRKGRVLNKRKADRIKGAENYFNVSNKYYYPQAVILVPFKYSSADTDRLYNGYRGSMGNRKDFEISH